MLWLKLLQEQADEFSFSREDLLARNNLNGVVGSEASCPRYGVVVGEKNG